MVNIVPVADEHEHICDTYCWCKPEVVTHDEETGELFPNGPLLRHWAADMRHIVEEATGEIVEDGKFWQVVP